MERARHDEAKLLDGHRPRHEAASTAGVAFARRVGLKLRCGKVLRGSNLICSPEAVFAMCRTAETYPEMGRGLSTTTRVDDPEWRWPCVASQRTGHRQKTRFVEGVHVALCSRVAAERAQVRAGTLGEVAAVARGSPDR